MSTTSSLGALSITLLAVSISAGCGGTTQTDSPAGTATAGEEAATAGDGHGHHAHGGAHAQGGATHHRPMAGRGPMACPMMLPGAQVAVDNTERGVAMTFTTERADQVEELRTRVRAMAAMHEQHGAMRGGRMMMPPATTSVVEVPGGARLELAAASAADVDALRRHASMQAEHMRGGRGCPMLGEAEPPA